MGNKGSSFCGTPAKQLHSLWSPACKLINSAAVAFILILSFDPIKRSNKKALEKDKKRNELFSISRSILITLYLKKICIENTHHKVITNEMPFANGE